MAWNSNKLPVEPITSPAGANAWDTTNPPVQTTNPPAGNAALPPPPNDEPSNQAGGGTGCPAGYYWYALGQECREISGGGGYEPVGGSGPNYNYDPTDRYEPPADEIRYANGNVPPATTTDEENYLASTGGGGFTPSPTPTLPSALTVDPYDVGQSPDWMNAPTSTGGVDAVNPNADAFDYGQVSDFSDAAWQNSMRYIEPQMELQDDRFAQDLINQGIDPYSEAGQKAFRQKSMAQNDMLSKSAFDSLGYGSALQNQMFGQDATRSQLANALLQSQMGLTQRGQEFDTQAGMSANEQAYNQMMGLEGLGYRDYLTGVDQSRYQDTLALALMGMAPGPSYTTTNTGLSAGPAVEYTNASNYFGNLYSG